jgi:cell division septal protein FtsQ
MRPRRKKTKDKKGPMVVARGPAAQPRAKLRHRLRPRWWMILTATMLVAVMVGVWQIPRLLREADHFRLDAVEFYGGRLLDGRQVLEVGGLDEFTNIFSVDLQQTAKRLEALAWVKRARVQRKPPNRLEISVVERRRLMWLKAGLVYGVDSEGVILPGHRHDDEGRADLDLPLLGGIELSVDSLEVGRAIEAPELHRLLDWWQQALVFDADLCMNVSEVLPAADGGIRLFLVGDDLEVRLPGDQVKHRLKVLRGMLARVYRECPDPAYIDLRFAGQVVVGSRTKPRKES